MIEGVNNLFDTYFSRFLTERSHLDSEKRERFRSLLCDLTSAYENGHSCLVVNQKEQTLLLESHLVSRQDLTPLVLHNNRLYLHRYFRYEQRLAQQLSAMASIVFQPKLIEGQLDKYFGYSDIEIDYQKEAASVALKRALTIICGGPGTGKTTTVVKILALLLETLGTDCTIALAAPTGKAAMRLQQSIIKNIAGLGLSKEITSAIPTEGRTLHRLLGVSRQNPQFVHNNKNPMGWDVVVVDEASMVDLALMSKLVDALKPGARLLLLGDKDQLASVESGAVLGDLIATLPDNSIELKQTFRFDSNIKALADNIKGGHCDSAWNNLNHDKTSNVRLLNQDLVSYIASKYQSYMEAVMTYPKVEASELLAIFNRFQVLCGVHFGSRGVEEINRGVEAILARRGFGCRPDNWYIGRPVMVNSNDYSLELFNGDIGICLPDESEKNLKVWFERSDGTLRSYSPYRLPRFQTVFAMTIHKSQGSEFDEVVVVFPEKDLRVLSRELVYTAVTRAKESVTIVADQEVFTQALSRKIERFSGLSGQLRQLML